MTEKPGKLPKVNDWDNIVRVINKSPKNFCIIQANSGFFGSTIYELLSVVQTITSGTRACVVLWLMKIWDL